MEFCQILSERFTSVLIHAKNCVSLCRYGSLQDRHAKKLRDSRLVKNEINNEVNETLCHSRHYAKTEATKVDHG